MPGDLRVERGRARKPQRILIVRIAQAVIADIRFDGDVAQGRGDDSTGDREPRRLGRALAGQSYKQILEAYYPKAQLSRI